VALAAGTAVAATADNPMLYAGVGGWAVVTGVAASTPPPGPGWNFEEGVWVGRIPSDAETLAWGDRILPVATAEPPPSAPAVLSPDSNPFGPCVVRSLSVRYDAVIRSHPWSVVFGRDGEAADFQPLELSGGRRVGLALVLEDAGSGQRWNLRPERMGREGSLFSKTKGNARFYAGALDDGDLDWNLVVLEEKGDRLILQGRLMVLKSPARLLRLRILLRTGAPGVSVVQEELPPGVVAAADGAAVALYVDLAEPRRFRAVADVPDSAGLEFDLAVTKATGNFPRSATFSLAVDSWPTENQAAAAREAVERLPRAGGSVDLPEAVAREGRRALATFEPSRLRLRRPAGFLDSFDAMQYLVLRTSGLFPDRDWAASAFQCAAQDAEGGPRIAVEGDSAILAVNPDPDLETMLEMGQNRGRVLLERIRGSGASAVWLQASGTSPGLDCTARALRMCDYPALWEEGATTPGVDLRHAESELFAALACVLQKAGVCLLVSDSGPLAPFTTYHADALVCESADPAEMRRQRDLAGQRPVLWLAEEAGPAAAELARNLGFVRP
jgi:hypothetical protein